MNEQIASLIEQLRDARNIEQAAKMDADDTAHQIDKLRIEWSARNRLHKEAGEEIAQIEQELAEAVNEVTTPYLASEVIADGMV